MLVQGLGGPHFQNNLTFFFSKSDSLGKKNLFPEHWYPIGPLLLCFESLLFNPPQLFMVHIFGLLNSDPHSHCQSFRKFVSHSLSSFVYDWVINDQNSIPLYAYHPSLYGLKNSIAPPKFNAGFRLQPVNSRTWVEASRDRFWVEKPQSWNAISDRTALRRVIKHHTIEEHPGVELDPRGFPHTAFTLPTKEEGVDVLGYEADVEPMQLQQWDAEQMLTTLFTWNVAAAHYQGFCSYLDLTYPIVSQGVITDGHFWQFYVLQTDTIQVWRDDDAYAKGSSMWMSRRMNMDDDADLIIKVLTNVLAKETREMSQKELQPYVTKSDEVCEVVKTKYNFDMKVL